MAMFGLGKKKKQGGTAAAQATEGSVGSLAWVLRAPRITEKATAVAEGNVYVFNVATAANKREIARAVAGTYNVTPRKVRTAVVPSQKVRRRGKTGETGRGKKAYVYLNKGEKIELI